MQITWAPARPTSCRGGHLPGKPVLTQTSGADQASGSQCATYANIPPFPRTSDGRRRLPSPCNVGRRSAAGGIYRRMRGSTGGSQSSQNPALLRTTTSSRSRPATPARRERGAVEGGRPRSCFIGNRRHASSRCILRSFHDVEAIRRRSRRNFHALMGISNDVYLPRTTKDLVQVIG